MRPNATVRIPCPLCDENAGPTPYLKVTVSPPLPSRSYYDPPESAEILDIDGCEAHEDILYDDDAFYAAVLEALDDLEIQAREWRARNE